MAQGLCDVVSQHSRHLQCVNEVGRVLQDGVVGHEVGGAHGRFIEIHRRAVGRVTTRGSQREKTWLVMPHVLQA